MTSVAVAQTGTVLFDTPATLDRMQAICEEARQKGVEFLVFPKAFVGGYPKGADFGARVGSRTPEGRDDFVRYYHSAITIPGPETARIGEFAREMQAYLVVGAIERDGDSGTLYCTALYVGPDGAIGARCGLLC